MTISVPEVVAGEPLSISATTYMTWKRCPARAGAHLSGEYGPDTRPAFVGSLAHRLFGRHYDRGPISPDDFEQACREEIGSSSLNSRMSGLELRPSSLRHAIEDARSLYERFARLQREGFMGSEVELSWEMWPGVTLRGKVDAVFESGAGTRLVDWKTGDLDEPVDQLLFYAMLWTVQEGETPEAVEAVSVQTGESISTRPTDSDLRRVGSEVAQLVNDVRMSWSGIAILERRAGPWCRHCPILEGCPEGLATGALLA